MVHASARTNLVLRSSIDHLTDAHIPVLGAILAQRVFADIIGECHNFHNVKLT
jgi:hypothetical protein